MHAKNIRKIMVLAAAMSPLLAPPSVYAAGTGTDNSASSSVQAADDDIEGTSVLSYDAAIAKLYDESMDITDEEILDVVDMMDSDFAEIDKRFNAQDAKNIEGVIKEFESQKAVFMDGGKITSSYSDDIIQAMQDEYDYMNQYVLSAASVRNVIPKISITDITKDEDGLYSLAAEEWITLEYGDQDEPQDVDNNIAAVASIVSDSEADDAASVCAFGYEMTIVVGEENGVWEIKDIRDTDENINELFNEENGGNSENERKEKENSSSTDNVEEGDEIQGATVENYNASKTYTTSGGKQVSYDVEAAIAYADKNCESDAEKDCTYFVSKCMKAGGLTNIKIDGNAQSFMDYCIKYYGPRENATNENIFPGNPVFYDYEPNGIINHSVICVGFKDGVPIVDSHSESSYHLPWSTGRSRGKHYTVRIMTSDVITKKTGWQQINGSWYYYNSDGKAVTGFQKLEWDGKTSLYYFDSNGKMQKDIKPVIDEKKYYIKTDGTVAIGWQQINGSWYYFDTSSGAMLTGFQTLKWFGGTNVFYFHEKGKMQTGIQIINDKKYYFDNNGVMQTGWRKIGSSWYYFGSDGAAVTGFQTLGWSGGTSLFYFDTNGAMKTGKWHIDKKNYYSDSDGVIQTGVQEIEGKKYFFGSDGTMQTGWQTADNKTYYFNKNGVMQTGWLELNGKKYYLGSNGARVTGIQEIDGKKYYFGNDGTMKTGWQTADGKMYYFGEDGVMKTGQLEINSRKYYLGSDGVRVSGIQKIDGKKYYFGTEKEGYVKSGWQKVDGKWYYFGDKDDSSMRTGWTTSNGRTYYLDADGTLHAGWLEENGRFYYFGEAGDKYQDNAMVQGKLVENIKSPDGSKTGTYYFNDDGIMVKDQVIYTGRAYWTVSADGACTKTDKTKKNYSGKSVITFTFGDKKQEKTVSNGGTIGSLKKYSEFSEDDLKKVSSDGNTQFIGWTDQDGNYISEDTVIAKSVTLLPVFSSGTYSSTASTDDTNTTNTDAAATTSTSDSTDPETEPGSNSEAGSTSSSANESTDDNNAPESSTEGETDAPDAGSTETENEAADNADNSADKDNTESPDTAYTGQTEDAGSGETASSANADTGDTKNTEGIGNTGDTAVTSDEKRIYKISYDLDGGKLENETDKYSDGDEITIESPTKEGYTFSGWIVNGSEDPVSEYKITADAKGDISLKAVWEENKDSSTDTSGNAGTDKDTAAKTISSTDNTKDKTENGTSATIGTTANTTAAAGTSTTGTKNTATNTSGTGSSVTAAGTGSNNTASSGTPSDTSIADSTDGKSETADTVQTGDLFSRGVIIGIMASAAAAIFFTVRRRRF